MDESAQVEKTTKWQVGHLTQFELTDPIIEDDNAYPSDAVKLAERLSTDRDGEPFAIWRIDDDESYLPDLLYIVVDDLVFKKG